MITVVIPYSGYKIGLAQLLVSLQPQLHPDDDIYIVDMSLERSAKNIVLAYGSSRCYIFVEPTTERGASAVLFGLQSMKENRQEGALIIEETCIISTTFIANLKKAVQWKDKNNKGFGFLVPKIVTMPHMVMDANFKWFGAPTQKVSPLKDIPPNSENCPCVYVKTIEIGMDYTTDMTRKMPVGCFENEVVVVLPHNKVSS